MPMSAAREDRVDGLGEERPVALGVLRHLSALACQAVVLPLAAVLTDPPIRSQVPSPMQLMQRRIQGSLFELKHVGATARGLLDDLVAVHVALGKKLED